MHVMVDSATPLRARRVAETSSALRAEARRLTIARGFTGFTIEELCSEVGVSRRTFFNYYASKENAVLGIPVRSDTTDLDEAFVSGGGTLLEDLAALHIARWGRLNLSKAEAEELGQVFEREPRLFQHFVELAAEGERTDIGLVKMRPGFDGDDLRAATAVHVMVALVRPAVFEYFSADGADETDFRTIFLRRLEAAYGLFSH